MEVTGLLLALLLAQTTSLLLAAREYEFVDLPKTWLDARRYCREKLVDLATVESAEDWARMKEMMENSGHKEAWTGLFDDARSWRWSLDGTYVYKDGTSIFRGWNRFSEDNYMSNQNCVLMNSTNGDLNDFICGRSLNSVCYDASSDTFIPVLNKKSWSSAQSYCRQEHTDLASMRNQLEREKLLNSMPSLTSWWIGLSREGWKWTDRSSSQFRMWAPYQPDQGRHDCAKATLYGWDDTDCDTELPFFCSVKNWKVVKVAVKADDSVNLDDPPVRESLQEQMEIHLKEQATQQQLQLRWRKPSTGNVFKQTHTQK